MIKLPTIKLGAAIGLASAFACGPSTAADLVAGQAAFEKFACASCHGADGKSSVLPSYPVLAGQHADYLRHALRSYQRGASGGGVNARSNAVMTALVPQLSDADIQNIAAWLSSLPSDLSVRR
ncbi:cytochrome c [Achromobacter sp. F4_2707]|uniref:c-type cytochrome n=1 Tax=Achromobacter sp. F4_2707 TaxID=3114286 RepID=UPI0039C647D9